MNDGKNDIGKNGNDGNHGNHGNNGNKGNNGIGNNGNNGNNKKKKNRRRGRHNTNTNTGSAPGSAPVLSNNQDGNSQNPGQRDGTAARGSTKGRGRDRAKGRHSGGGKSSRVDAQADQSQKTWRAVEKPYREYLVKSGLAINAAAFSAMSFERKISAREAYTKEKNTVANGLVPVLLEMAVENMKVGWDRISENRTSHESITVKQDSIRFYGLHGINHCQILGNGIKDVMNAHIWPYNNKKNLRLMSLEEADINNPRNVLRLHKDIEYHFDRFFLTIVPSGGNYIVKILDPTIAGCKIRDTNLTLGDIEGKPLLIPSRERDKRPWRRLLATHSIFAHRQARENNHLPEDQLTAAEVTANEMMDFSLDEEAQARMKLFFHK